VIKGFQYNHPGTHIRIHCYYSTFLLTVGQWAPFSNDFPLAQTSSYDAGDRWLSWLSGMRPDFCLLRNFIPTLRCGVYVACVAKLIDIFT